MCLFMGIRNKTKGTICLPHCQPCLGLRKSQSRTNTQHPSWNPASNMQIKSPRADSEFCFFGFLVLPENKVPWLPPHPHTLRTSSLDSKLRTGSTPPTSQSLGDLSSKN